MPSTKNKVSYTDPVTGKIFWLEADELIQADSHSLKGTPKGAMDKDTKDKISKALKQSHAKNIRVHTDKTKATISESLKGKVTSEETRKKMSEKAKALWAKRKADGHTVSTKTKQALSMAGKGKVKSAEHRAKISAALKARHNSKQTPS